jgi:DNA-binding XRE family transcriptional regulator
MSPAEYRAHRGKLGLTQTGLAARLGVPRESISRRETGEQRITPEAVLALRALSPARARRSGGSNNAMSHERSELAP